MKMTEIALSNIDRLQTLDLQGAALPYGVKAALFAATQQIQKGSMVGAAARALNCEPALIGIFTGAQVPEKMPLGENDGPLGSVVLADALCQIGHSVRIYTDDAAAKPIEKLLLWRDIEVEVVRIQRGEDTTLVEIGQNIDIAIAVERLGGNPNGILYGATGVSRSEFRCNFDTLFNTVSNLGKTTIGIADGGNEIGCGKIHAVISETMTDLNFVGRTPCGGGVFSVVPTDVLVVATTSNLGCAGIVAALALLRGEPDLCHTAKNERKYIDKGVEFGLTDGGTGRVTDAVDGVAAEDHAAMVGLMESIVKRALASPEERGF